jgi:hypothetical protein
MALPRAPPPDQILQIQTYTSEWMQNKHEFITALTKQIVSNSSGGSNDTAVILHFV